MTIEELARSVRSRLAAIYGEGEAKAMVRLAFHAMYGWDTTQYILRSDREASEDMQKRFEALFARLATHEPIQYILGQADFYGMIFKVEPGVLIPRPETAGLVDWIVDDYKERRDLRVLDVGTGTGCIAVSLALNLPFAEVTAIDVNPIAVSLASSNARSLHARIRAEKMDVFSFVPEPESLDIIVSNPPYIAEKEKTDMAPNVLLYEPEEALFVPDDDPLKFYRRIAQMAKPALRSGGSIYFEINPLYAAQTISMLQEQGWSDVEARKDYCGKVRFLRACLPLNRINKQ